MTVTVLGLCLAVITLLVTLFGIVWKGAAVATEMHAGLAELRATVSELKEGLKLLQKLPMLEQRVEQLEKALHLEVKGRLATMWEKIFSIDKHVAVEISRRGSSPDPGETNE